MAELEIGPWSEKDIPEMREIWNEVVEDARAFPQEEPLSPAEAADFFASQSHCGVARPKGEDRIVGLYVLHPNNVGRCGHICNASYAVARKSRGLGAGEALVRDSLKEAARLGFRILQFNAVTKSNEAARKLYKKLAFIPLGEVPGGYRRKDGSYEDIRLYYHEL